MIVLHSERSKASRKFVALYGGIVTVINIDNKDVVQVYLDEGYPSPSGYPFLVHERYKVGKRVLEGYSELSEMVNKIPYKVSVYVDKADIQIGDSVLLSVMSEIDVASVPIAVWGDDTYLGSFDVPLTAGEGEVTKSIDVTGVYKYKVDDIPHPDWPELNLYRNEQSAEVIANA